jgi:hypothetical protein
MRCYGSLITYSAGRRNGRAERFHMNAKAWAIPTMLSVTALIVLALAAARAEQSTAPASGAAIMTLYRVASSPTVESGDISFSSISAAASSRIELWAREAGVSVPNEVFYRRGYTLSYDGKSYDCFRFPKGQTHYIVCVRDNGEFLGSIAVPRTVPQPPQ